MSFKVIIGTTAKQHSTPSLFTKKNQENLTHENVCVILDHMKHDLNAVHTFLEKVLNVLKMQYPTLQKCVCFSDSSSSQYKNYKAFSNLTMPPCHHQLDFGLNVEWNLFATSHGKSVCDGTEGTVKCLVGNTLLKMFEWCRKNINAIEFIFVLQDEVESHIVDYGVEETYLTWSKVPGTRSFHWYKPCSKTFPMHCVSSDDVMISHRKQPTEKAIVLMDDCQTGK